jgi:arylsulfatase A-like enzyme
MYDINDFYVPESNEAYLQSLPKPAAKSIRAKKEQLDLDPELAKKIKHAYYATTSFVDAQVGRVLDKLKETGLDKNTIVVFTSDHGYHLGEHGHWQKQTLFNDATRVPLIFAGPGIKSNKGNVNAPVELVDIYPTIMDMLQMKTPQFVQGKSLMPYFDGARDPVRKNALTELRVNSPSGWSKGYSIKTKRYRLTQWQHEESMHYELYDHKFDAAELNNIATKAAYALVLDSLRFVIQERIAAAKKIPKGLGRQIDFVKPWREPRRILPRPK